MSDPRTGSIPTHDVNIILELSLAEDSFDESDLRTHFRDIRIRDDFCLAITPKNGFDIFIITLKKSQICLSLKERVYVS